MHAEKCPVCKGRGWVRKLIQWYTFPGPNWPEVEPCHACDKLGYILVPDGFPVVVLPQIVITPPQTNAKRWPMVPMSGDN